MYRSVASIITPLVLGSLMSVTGLAAGCSPRASIRFSSSPYRAKVPIERLMVHLDLAGWGLPAPLYGRLEATLTEALTACHVTPRIWRTDPAQPEDATRFRDDVNAFQPSAILTVKAAERHFDGTQSFVNKAFRNPTPPPAADPLSGALAVLIVGLIGAAAYRAPTETLLSNLTLFDAASATSIWQARSEFRYAASDDMADLFERFAVFSAGTVSRLRDEGVLKHCRDRLDDLLCRVDRRAALLAAAQIKDPAARAAAFDDAPRCGPRSGR